MFDALNALHPAEPHSYLGTLGVAPRLQGRGVGTALLRHWLARVDRDPSAVYLETDRPEYVGFYERAGFEVLGETEVVGVPIWRLLRPPRTGSPDALESPGS